MGYGEVVHRAVSVFILDWEIFVRGSVVFLGTLHGTPQYGVDLESTELFYGVDRLCELDSASLCQDWQNYFEELLTEPGGLY